MRHFALRRFENQYLVLDDSEFVDCVFEDCTLHLTEDARKLKMDGCDIIRCKLTGCWPEDVKAMSRAKGVHDINGRWNG